jgi:hypothetical protein
MDAVVAVVDVVAAVVDVVSQERLARFTAVELELSKVSARLQVLEAEAEQRRSSVDPKRNLA